MKREQRCLLGKYKDLKKCKNKRKGESYKKQRIPGQNIQK